MKKVIKKEVSVCYRCGSDENVFYSCKNCGIDHCWECKKLYGHEYAHGVHFTGSGDGYYCQECDMVLYKSGKNDLYNYYQKIKELKNESTTL